MSSTDYSVYSFESEYEKLEDIINFNNYISFEFYDDSQIDIIDQPFGFRLYVDGKIVYYDSQKEEYIRLPNIVKFLRNLGYFLYEDHWLYEKVNTYDSFMQEYENDFNFNFSRLVIFDQPFGLDYYYKGITYYHTGDNGDLMYMPYWLGWDCFYYVYHDFR